MRHVEHEHVDRHDVAEIGAGFGQRDLQVLEGLNGLPTEVGRADDFAVAIEPDLSRHVDETAGVRSVHDMAVAHRLREAVRIDMSHGGSRHEVRRLTVAFPLHHRRLAPRPEAAKRGTVTPVERLGSQGRIARERDRAGGKTSAARYSISSTTASGTVWWTICPASGTTSSRLPGTSAWRRRE
jgi:hypothetical protein